MTASKNGEPHDHSIVRSDNEQGAESGGGGGGGGACVGRVTFTCNHSNVIAGASRCVPLCVCVCEREREREGGGAHACACAFHPTFSDVERHTINTVRGAITVPTAIRLKEKSVIIQPKWRHVAVGET